ncbi:hypothetical protein AHAS_Ahas17G0189300 [Arachis hypogaea]
MAVFSQHAGNVVMWRVEMGGSALPTRGEHVALESVKNYRFLLVSYDAAVTRDIVLQTYQHAGDSPHPDNQRRGGFYPLLAALVERWRPETHTFVLPVGEVTVILEDVTYIFRLPIDGEPVRDWTDSSSDFVHSQSIAIFGCEPGVNNS